MRYEAVSAPTYDRVHRPSTRRSVVTVTRPSVRRYSGVAAAIVTVFVVGTCIAACGGPAPRRITNPTSTTAPATDTGTLTDPVAAGFPPNDALQADPAAVARELTARSTREPWTVTWDLRSDTGDDIGDMAVSRIPAGADPAQVFVSAKVGVPGIKLVRIDLLDKGSGARSCVQDGSAPWVCDRNELKSLYPFLSIDGLARINDGLLLVTSQPKATARYGRTNGVPVACFDIPPTPTTGSTLGLDFSNGGSYCLTSAGALAGLDAGAIKFSPAAAAPSADPGIFKLPVAK